MPALNGRVPTRRRIIRSRNSNPSAWEGSRRAYRYSLIDRDLLSTPASGRLRAVCDVRVASVHPSISDIIVVCYGGASSIHVERERRRQMIQLIIAPLIATDKLDWRRLYDGYAAFYKVPMNDVIADRVCFHSQGVHNGSPLYHRFIGWSRIDGGEVTRRMGPSSDAARPQRSTR